jgi:hypothetical protein
MDEIIIVVIGLIGGIVLDSPVIGSLVGYYLRGKYINLRDTKPHGYVFHFFREKGLTFDDVNKGTSYQPVEVKEFIS